MQNACAEGGLGSPMRCGGVMGLLHFVYSKLCGREGHLGKNTNMNFTIQKFKMHACAETPANPRRSL